MKNTKKTKPLTKPLKKKENDYSAFFIGALSFIVIVVVLFLSYVSRSSFNSRNNNNSSSGSMVGVQKASITVLAPDGSEVDSSQMVDGFPYGQSAISAAGRVVYKVDKFKKLALQPLDFDVFDQNKKALKPEDLKEVNGAKMHYVIMRADLKNFQHLQPTFQNGKWHVLANVPDAGTYYGFVDIAPVNGNPVVLKTELISQQVSPAVLVYPAASAGLSFTAKNSLQAQLQYANNILSFLVARAGKPVTNLQPMLGAFGYVTVVKHGDKNSFIHPLPTNTSKPAEGRIEFISALEPGVYTAFAEFKQLNRVTTFPITFEVK